MPAQFSDLMKQDFSDLEVAAKSWRALAESLETAQVQHRHRVTGPLHASGWEGTDAHYGFMTMEDNERKLGICESQVTSIATALKGTHHRMQQAQQDLRKAVREAEADNFAVDEDGWVSDPTYDNLPPEARNDPDYQQSVQRRSGPLGEYRARIDKAIADAETASDEGSALLHQIDTFDLDKVYGANSAQEDAERVADAYGLDEKDIPNDKNPKENAAWWKSLSPAERQMYMDAYPQKVGWLDGIPSADRDEANRKSLELSLGAFREKEEAGTLGINDERRYSGLLELQDELDKADGTTKPHRELYVLGIDADRGDGRALVARGNPDTADNTAIQVPGTDNDLSHMNEHIDRADRLQESAMAADKRASTSVVSWLGYDAPEFNNSVGSEARARDGEQDLRSFTHGLRESHQGERTHMTVLGHSYGSTLVGAAASGGQGLDADDVVVVGSPGMTVDHASELNMDPDHVWAGYAPDDIVSDELADRTLGENPAEEEFGGNVFEVDTEGHTGYWDENSESLRNQGKIIAGRSPSEGQHQEND
ncbi:alpha/beta hydrolase [Streptomyces cavernicola]|uniref:Alpha/beta hydrolase n=1 Tax=Streptomyces cavernicola TaxID=3043613 RepID=A0ABT6SIC1_9ACTN|nr:alpha/beta hydrolase [Streptomyces sp. B-S-A6]MDI3407941.1 alpha/beta hydrolase [Streptomyces sp. B-S-A6]